MSGSSSAETKLSRIGSVTMTTDVSYKKMVQ